MGADGRIVVAGGIINAGSIDFAVAQYLENGSLDASFADGGLATVDFAGGVDFAFAIAFHSDGRIVVGGFGYNDSNRDFAIARLTSMEALTAILATAVG